jgi:hypothetical protein
VELIFTEIPPIKDIWDMPVQEFALNSSKAYVLHSKNGCKITVKPGCFKVENGDTVTVLVTEYNDPTDFLGSGLPMSFTKDGQEFMYQSEKMMKIEALVDDKPVELLQMIGLECPDVDILEGLRLYKFHGREDAFVELKSKKIPGIAEEFEYEKITIGSLKKQSLDGTKDSIKQKAPTKKKEQAKEETKSNKKNNTTKSSGGGVFRGTTDFDPNTGAYNLTATGGGPAYPDIFLLKLDTSGNFVWVKGMGGTNSDNGYSLDLDNQGNIYMVGNFRDTVDFDPNAGVYNLTAIGLSDIFVQKLNSQGNLIWAKSLGGPNEDRGYSIVIDDFGSFYITGNFSGLVDFDPSSNIYNLNSPMFDAMFIQKLDSSGNFVWAISSEGGGGAVGSSIAVDGSGDVYTTGFFYGTTDFDPSTGVSNLTVQGAQDVFIQKINQNLTPFNNINDNRFQVNVYPNPCSNKINIDICEYQESHILIIDNLGRVLVSKKTNIKSTDINFSSFSPGVYYLSINNGKQTVNKKIMKK